MTQKALPKLLIATDAYLPRWDGIARYLHETMQGLEDHFDITVIAPLFPGFEDHKDKKGTVRIIRVPTFKVKAGDYYPPTYQFKIVREEVKQTDIVWTHAIMPIGKLGIWYGKKFGKTVISTIHSYEWELARDALHPLNLFKFPLHLISRTIANFFYNRCSLLLVPDDETTEVLAFNHIKAPTKVIHLGVDTKTFHPPKDKGKAKEALGIDPKKLVIGYAGRLGREKNLETLFRAFKKLRKEHPHIHLLIGGKGVNHYKNLFASTAHATFLPESNQIQQYFQAMDIYVLPSLTETTSLSTMEAMACGIPVVVTKVGYVKKYVKERVNGLFFPKKNSAMLALRIETLIKDETLREALGQVARQTMVDDYSWDKTRKDIRKTFKEF